jgi:predicted metal-dependent hydrolase
MKIYPQKETDGIIYTVRTTLRTRKVIITVHPHGEVVVSASPRIPHSAIENMIKEKRGWIQEKIKEQALRPKKLLSHFSVKDFKENKEKARILVTNRLEYFNQFYKYKFGKIYIRNQKSRWGSCSGKGNLNFNYKIVFLPSELADYIIIHELCHLKEMNHGQKFWDLVALHAPHHKSMRQLIKKY